MNVQGFNIEDITVNPDILTRKSDPTKKDIEPLVSSMADRIERGLEPQEVPGVVQVTDEGKNELLAGRNRLEALKSINASLPKGSDPYKFFAVVRHATVVQDALLDGAAENLFRKAVNLWDKAVIIEKLAATGMTQKQIAEKLQIKESTVSDIRRCGGIPKKMQSAKLTEEAFIVLARYNNDPALQEDLLAVADQERISREEAEKAAKERQAEATAAEAEQPEEEKAEGSKKKSSSKSAAPKSEAVKSKPKRGGKKTPTGTTTAGDVKKAVAKRGVQKRETASRKSIAQLVNMLQALFGKEVKEEVPEPYSLLAETIESWADGDLSDLQFRNRWEKCVKSKL